MNIHRRNSPSVTTSRPQSICRCTAERIASSSIAVSAAIPVALLRERRPSAPARRTRRSRRASCGGRSREPTVSARAGRRGPFSARRPRPSASTVRAASRPLTTAPSIHPAPNDAMSPPANTSRALRRDLFARVAALPAGWRREPRPLRERIGDPIVPVARHAPRSRGGRRGAPPRPPQGRSGRCRPTPGEPHHQTTARHLAPAPPPPGSWQASRPTGIRRARHARPPAPSSSAPGFPSAAILRFSDESGGSNATSGHTFTGSVSTAARRTHLTAVGQIDRHAVVVPPDPGHDGAQPELASDVVRDGLDQARAPVRERLPDAQERVVEPVPQERGVGQDAQAPTAARDRPPPIAAVNAMR